jgi:amidase
MPLTFRPPTLEDLREAAASLGFELPEETARRMMDYAGNFSDAFAWLAGQPDELPPLRYPERSHRRPRPEENRYGGWAVLTEIGHAPSGPLAGRTVAIKDNAFVAGVPMGNGTDFLADFLPDFDATVVTRLLDAGAIIRGKAACEFLCCSGGSATAASGMVRNPVNPAYSAGGSSSGSAALVAGGEADMALGGDQAGSIRIPSSFCGVYGMKPTHGLVPMTGILGMEGTLDHAGPMTASVADNALMLEVIAGPDGFDGRQQNPLVHRYTAALAGDASGLRIGVMEEGFAHHLSEPDVDECVRAAAARLEDLGAAVERVNVPMHRHGVAIWGGVISDALWQTLWFNGVQLHAGGILSPAFNAAMNGWEKRLAGFPANAQLFVLLGKYLERYRGHYYARARNLVLRLRRGYDEALSDFDLLLLPTTVQKAIPNPETPEALTADQAMAAAFNTIFNTCQFDITGHPAMSVPCGMREGRPVGMMLVARHWNEPAIYRAASALERSGDWRSW